jgi:hypothetical protein
MIPHTISHLAKQPFKPLRGAVLATMITLLAFGWAGAQGTPNASTATLSQEETGEQMTISGRLVGPDDKPVAGGQVAVVVAQYRRSERPMETGFQNAVGGLDWEPKLFGTAKTDEEGRFRLSGPRYSASRPYTRAILFAAGPDYGLTLHPVDHARLHQETIVRLQPEQIVRGRLIDLQGQPAVGVTLHYVGWFQQWEVPGVEKCVPFWPKPVTTDDKGRFLFRALGLPKATLEARHPRFAPQWLTVETDGLENAKEATLSLVGERLLRGRVAYADTGKPAAFVQLFAVALDRVPLGLGFNYVEGRTDAQGRFSLNTFPGNYQLITVQPPEESPYRTLRQVVPWSQAARQQVDLALPRGVLVRGIVKEHASGKPIAGARVQFRPRTTNNPFYRQEFQRHSDEEHFETAISDPDGRFQLGVLPGPGHLLVLGPTLDYIPVETSWVQLEYGHPGGERYYPDGLLALETKPGVEAREVTLELRRGVTLQGRVVGPDGKVVDRFMMLCRHYRPTGFTWWQRRNLLEGRDGRFELPGCDPEKPFTVWLLDPDNELGATVELSAKQTAGKTVTVRLERCGSAVVRFVDKDGKPLANYHPFFSIVVTPGASMAATAFLGHEDKKELEGDWLNVPFWVRSPYGRHMWANVIFTDAQGLITFRTLIPGATYRIMVTVLPKGGMDEVADKGWPTRDFAVKSGETLALSDVATEKQRSRR